MEKIILKAAIIFYFVIIYTICMSLECCPFILIISLPSVLYLSHNIYLVEFCFIGVWYIKSFFLIVFVNWLSEGCIYVSHVKNNEGINFE